MVTCGDVDNEKNMATVAEPLLLTVEQYRHLPVCKDVVQELHWGQVVTLTRPKMRHSRIQHRLVELLRPKVESKGIVAAEVAFRAMPEYDLRGADVAFVSQLRWDGADEDDNLRGSPELVIEVLSPSNTKVEIREKAALYLSTGAQEFWVVDPKRKTVSVATRDANPIVYGVEDCIPLRMFNAQLEVELIFR
jgi:Uma2 family endonuclease